MRSGMTLRPGMRLAFLALLILQASVSGLQDQGSCEGGQCEAAAGQGAWCEDAGSFSQYPSGVPSREDFLRNWGSPRQAELLDYSDAWAAHHDFKRIFAEVLGGTFSDHARHWSRLWEYTYHLAALKHAQRHFFGGRPLQIMDAGVGFSFFPFLVADRLQSEVHGVDSSQELLEAYYQAGVIEHENVHLYIASMQQLPFEDSHFDAVVCVSVLEHTERRAQALAEIYRVLRPGGVFVLSMDVSVDSRNEISVPEAKGVLTAAREAGFEEISEGFSLESDLEASVLRENDILTSTWMHEREPESLPWLSRTPEKHLTITCHVFRRPAWNAL